jgi:hypothetical protein
VYELTGFLAFEDVTTGYCNLQVAFFDPNGQTIQMVDLPEHKGSREFAFDFTGKLKFRAPDGAILAKVGCFLQGPGTAWFDDLYFGRAQVGRIVGTVACRGEPLEGARVYLHGDPWDKVCEAYTDEAGDYEIHDVPAAFPRYAMIAEKEGYRTAIHGDVDVPSEGATTVIDLQLARGSDPIDVDNLVIKRACLGMKRQVATREFPPDAEIPSDINDYPDSVRPYLLSNELITSDAPEVLALTQQIIDSLDPAQRRNTYDVAKAAHEWVSKNIHYEELAGNDTAYRDVTAGVWQTVSGDGWCWGRNFYDWLKRPAETLHEESAICVEHALLGCALFRALRIPARQTHGTFYVWVQGSVEPDGWITMATSKGALTWRDYGNTNGGFGGGVFSNAFPVTDRPLVYFDWDWVNPGFFREKHTWNEVYEGSAAGLNRAHDDLDMFASAGETPKGIPGASADKYIILYGENTLSLYNIGYQRKFVFRFPLIMDSYAYTYEGRWEYWTNHPECIERTWVEQISNPPVEGIERWVHIEFDLASVLRRSDLDGDGDTDLKDFAAQAKNWLTSGEDLPGDSNGDEQVNMVDFAAFVEHWLLGVGEG